MLKEMNILVYDSLKAVLYVKNNKLNVITKENFHF